MKTDNQQGSITLEAALGLGVFIFAFVMLLSLALYATIENRTQYAIDQTAREISQYYYVLARAGLMSSTDMETWGEIDSTIDSAFGLANAIDTGYNSASSLSQDASSAQNGEISSQKVSDLVDGISAVGSDAADIQAASEKFMQSGQNLFDDPKSVIKALAKSALETGMNSVISKVIAQPLCQALSKKYFVSGETSADDVLNNWGVVNQAGDAPGGMAGLDFRMSTFLADGRSINVVVVYRVKSIIPLVFPNDHFVCQTASTAAWARGTSLQTKAAP